MMLLIEILLLDSIQEMKILEYSNSLITTQQLSKNIFVLSIIYIMSYIELNIFKILKILPMKTFLINLVILTIYLGNFTSHDLKGFSYYMSNIPAFRNISNI